MSADPTNTSLYSDADVYIAPLGSPLPATAGDPFSAAWKMVGLLSGEDGFSTVRTVEKANHFAWGGMLFKIVRKNFSIEKKFSVYEINNPDVRTLIWPGSAVGVIGTPVPANVMIAFETREGGATHRLISRNYAQIDVDGDINENETDPAKVSLVATIVPDANKIFFDEQGKPTVVSIAITGLTLALSMAGKITGKLVATATYSDASTADISRLALWTSATPAKATVDVGGYVTGVATGTANISCTYGGVSSAAPCVVTVSA